MATERDIDLVDELRAQRTEGPWLEFKSNLDDEGRIGLLVSALANSARLKGRETAYLIWGVEDQTHEVVGTSFDPFSKKVGNQDFQFWLRQKLRPAPAFDFREVDHPQGRVVLLEISAPTMMPITYEGDPYIRVGNATPKLTGDPETHQALMERMRPYNWETGVASSHLLPEEVLQLLDYPSYFGLTKQPLPESRDGVLQRLEADRLIRRDVGGRWDVFNLGAILFAKDLREFGVSLERKAVRVVQYDGNDKTLGTKHRLDERKGYASGFDGLVGHVNTSLPQNERIGRALRESRPLVPEPVIREVIANALIHQDMTITGAGPMVELFTDRVEVTNPGRPLIETDRMVDLPPRSRNQALAALMRRMGMCEEQGSGLDMVFRQMELWQLPSPHLRVSEHATQVVLHGPRKFSKMSWDERIWACYWHAVLKYLAGERMKNSSLCDRLGIERKNAAIASGVIRKALDAGLIKCAEEERPRAGYHPIWA